MGFSRYQQDLLAAVRSMPDVDVAALRQFEELLRSTPGNASSAPLGDASFSSAQTGDPARDWQLLQELSCRDPEGFWAAALKELAIQFQQPPGRVLSLDSNPDRCLWLPGACLNIAWSALHSPRASAKRPAIVWADESDPAFVRTMSMKQLQQQAAHVAMCLRKVVKPGDAVAINMPMTVASVIIYLGIVLSGCFVVSIADSFAAHEIQTRLDISKAKAIFTQDEVLRGNKSLPLYSRVVEAQAPIAIVVPASTASTTSHDTSSGGFADWLPSAGPSVVPAEAPQAQQDGLAVQLRPGDLSWQAFLAQAPPTAAFHAHMANANDPSNILFSSGTTGEPKAVVWTHITPIRCAIDGWAHQDIQPGNVVCWPTNLGWMMGPWVLYATFLNGATLALYQGAPLGRDFGEFVSAAHVNVLGVVPSIIKAWRHSNCMKGIDWSHLKCLSSTGEASAPDDYHWLMALVGYRPIIEYCGGTEIGGGFLSGTLLQPQCPSTFSTPTLGAQLVLLGPDGTQSPHHAVHGRQRQAQPFVGEVALVPPMLGSSQRLLNKDHFKVYYEGMPLDDTGSGRPLRRHGDEVQRLPGGYYCALGRTDDTMNLGGVKVSSVELERAVLESVPGIAEVAAVGVPPPSGGPETLVLFLVLKPPAGSSISSSSALGAADLQRLKRDCQEAIRARLNPLFKVERCMIKEGLPRTASNKVMRRVLRSELLPASKL